MWQGGAYSNEDSIDGTAQLNAKARGMLQALDDMSELIRNLGAKTKMEE